MHLVTFCLTLTPFRKRNSRPNVTICFQEWARQRDDLLVGVESTLNQEYISLNSLWPSIADWKSQGDAWVLVTCKSSQNAETPSTNIISVYASAHTKTVYVNVERNSIKVTPYLYMNLYINNRRSPSTFRHRDKR